MLKDFENEMVELQTETPFEQTGVLLPESFETGFARDANTAEKPNFTEESEPILTEEYELIYEKVTLFNCATKDTYFMSEDTYADLYMRKLRSDAGEFMEFC